MSPIKTILETNFTTFCFALEQASLEGYELDRNDPPGLWGMAYEARLKLNDERAAEYVPKPSRAEILAKARAAKAAKSVEATQ